MTRRAPRLAVALAAATAVWFGYSGVVSGHALILESLPRPDATVPSSLSSIVLRFNSRIEHSLSRVWILTPSGRRMPLREIVNTAPDRLMVPVHGLAPGTYTIEWQVLSVDGHITRGSFPFRVAPAP